MVYHFLIIICFSLLVGCRDDEPIAATSAQSPPMVTAPSGAADDVALVDTAGLEQL